MSDNSEAGSVTDEVINTENQEETPVAAPAGHGRARKNSSANTLGFMSLHSSGHSSGVRPRPDG